MLPNLYQSSSRNGCKLKPPKMTSLVPKTNRVLLLLLLLLLLVAGRCGAHSEGWPPRITIQPNDLVAVEGESAELNCEAEGQPAASIEWYHNGQLIRASTQTRTTMGGSIQFLDLRPSASSQQLLSGRPSDVGIYHCLARNELGQAKSRNASLQVAYIKPEFIAEPRDKLASIGDTVTFDCLPQAWPEPQIQWRHNGRLIEPNESPQLPDGSAKYIVNRIAKAGPSGSLASADDAENKQQPLIDIIGSQLVIKRVDKHDEGKYSCLIKTKGSHRVIERESSSALLSALVKPYFIESPTDKSVQVGGQVRLRCRIGGDPDPVISWRKQNGQPLSEKAQIDPVDKTLTLDHLSVTDGGAYVCEGENSVGSARAEATVSVNSRPRFTIQPEDQEVESGASVQIRCAGDANPKPMLFWYKEGHRQLMFAPNTISTSSRQSIDWPQASSLMNGPSSLSDTSPAINKLFSMPITSDSTSSYGNNYFGNRIYVDNQGTLNIINTTTSDNGYYACALISSVGSVMAKAKLNVKRLPNSPVDTNNFYDPTGSHELSRSNNLMPSNSKYDLLPPPVIKMGAVNQTLPTNTSATLVCEVVSQVSFRIQWFFESQPLQEEPPRVVVLESGALSIDNLRTSDSGIYTCVVTAATDQTMPLASPFEPLDSTMLTSAPPIQQSTSHSTILKVASPLNPNIQFYKMNTYAYPSSPGPAYLVSTNGNDAITIAWAAPADSGSLPIKEYIVEHYDTSQENLGWRVIYRIKGKESLLIDGLSVEGSHFFIIRAANSHGVGPSSAIAGPMRTVAGETRYQLELQRLRMPQDSKRVNSEGLMNMRAEANVARDKLMSITTNLLSLTPVSSTSIRLQWSTQAVGNLTGDSNRESDFSPHESTYMGDFLEGYSIRYRAIGLGESLLSKDPLLGNNWNIWPPRDAPVSLPLITSYLESEDEEAVVARSKRELSNYLGSSHEFNEVRVVEHSTEHYTVNGLRPFSLYQFFVVPYYKDIDGVPSNILSAQTNEDRPAVAPPNLTVKPINNTAIRLLWLHVPPLYTNGILRSYKAKINRSNIGQETHKILDLPVGSLTFSPSPSESKGQPNIYSLYQYVVQCDVVNLTYNSFYSVQVAAATSVGHGPWSEPQNFVMDPKVLEQLNGQGTDIEDVMSKSLLLGSPQTYSNGGHPNAALNLYLVISLILIVVSVILIAGYVMYRRNDQRVMAWKKTISEHLTDKFYMPSTSDPRVASTMPQNIYDHQQHLIYSGSTHIVQQSIPAQTIWTNNGCITSSGTESLSSHGGLLPTCGDPNNIRGVGEQVVIINNKDMMPKFAKNGTSMLVNQCNIDQNRQYNGQIMNHGDYYSVINNMAEYEELDTRQKNKSIPIEQNHTASSNSDTSCPSSVTRLLPNYNRDLLNHQRHEMVLQQQVNCHDGKQAFASMISNDSNRMQSMMPLSPYATTNLMHQNLQSNQKFGEHQISLVGNNRGQNFVVQNGGVSVDDSSKALMNQQQMNGHNPMSVFRTLQRNPAVFQQRAQYYQQASPQMFINSAIDSRSPMVANIVPNPMVDVRSNVYEHIDYSIETAKNQRSQGFQNPSSSTSSNSMKSNSNPHTIDVRRGSGATYHGEVHDLHVFSSPVTNESQRLNGQDQSFEEIQAHRQIKHEDEQGQDETEIRRVPNTRYDGEVHDLRVFSSQTHNENPRSSGNEKPSWIPSSEGDGGESQKTSTSGVLWHNLTPYHIAELEKEFSLNRYLTRPNRIHISQRLELTEHQVKAWFEHKRRETKNKENDFKKEDEDVERITETSSFLNHKHC